MAISYHCYQHRLLLLFEEFSFKTKLKNKENEC